MFVVVLLTLFLVSVVVVVVVAARGRGGTGRAVVVQSKCAPWRVPQQNTVGVLYVCVEKPSSVQVVLYDRSVVRSSEYAREIGRASCRERV